MKNFKKGKEHLMQLPAVERSILLKKLIDAIGIKNLKVKKGKNILNIL